MKRFTKALAAMMLMMTLVIASGCKPDEPEKGSIYGTVTDYATGEPVANANVQLRPGGETTLTGTDGMYEFLDVSVGDYSITVSKAEYTDLIDDFVIQVKDGKKTRRDVQIKKRPASMHLYDNDNQEISELDFGADVGVIKRTFNIFNGGTERFDFLIEKSVDWITNISQTSGSVDVNKTLSIVITIDRSLLAAGDNTTTLLITSSIGGGKELIIKARNNGELPIVNILEAIEIDSATYRIRCEVVSDGGHQVTERGICWNVFGGPTIDDEVISYNSGGVGPYVIRMENLSSSTRYYVCAYAKNAMGIGFSEVFDFVPGTQVSLPSVSTVEVHDVTATSAVCRGNVTDDGGADLIERGVCWGKNANPSISGQHQVANGATTGEFSVSVNGLDSNTTYHVRAYAKNSRGTAYGRDLTFTTTEGMPSVTTSSVTNITATSAKGGGTVTNQGASAVTERGICWSMSHSPTLNDSHANSGSGTGSFAVSMTELTPNKTYYVRAYAINSQGTVYGSEISFSTLVAATLPTVTTNTVTNITQNTATCGGNVTNSGSAVVTARGVCWSTSSNPTISNSHTINESGTGSFTSSITGLSANTTYYVRAYATNSAGTAYGEQKTFETSTSPFPIGAINGLFSVSATQQVYFSKGNLQYTASTNTWRFAENQYDVIGSANANTSSTYFDWIDLFCWGTSGYDHGAVCYQPWSTSPVNRNYKAYGSFTYDLNSGSGKADWGYNSISNGGNTTNLWRTLKNYEWEYLFKTRATASGIRFFKARVNDINGVVLLPDNWNNSNYGLYFVNNGDASYMSNIINLTNWINIFEANGAVFLPAAGYRDINAVNDVDVNGYYWSTIHCETDNAYLVYYTDSYLSPNDDGNKSFGLSVRLVQDY